MAPHLPHRAVAGLSSLALLVALAPGAACKIGKNTAGMIANNPSATEALAPSKCRGEQAMNKPLVIEWPAAERAALEARASKGVVPVRFNGCELEVLTDCMVADLEYNYVGLTPRSDSVRIRDTDELYANLPVGAAKLEAKLAKAGQLNVDMIIAGRLEAPPRERYREYDLKGHQARCKTATHVITGITVGAFQFTSGGSAEVGGGAQVEGVGGAGARSTSNKGFISSGGRLDACSASQPGSVEAPPLCREMLRIEVVEVERPRSAPASASASASGGGVLGVRDQSRKDTGPAPAGWTPALERKRKLWAGLAYAGLAGFALGGVAALVGVFVNSRGEKRLAELGVDGNSSTLALTGSDRVQAIRQAQFGKPLLVSGYVALAAGGLLLSFALPIAQKLKKQKDALSARVAPMLTRGGGGASLRMRF